MPVAPTEPADVLRGAGLRVTAARVATLRALRTTPHASAEAVTASVRADLGTVSTQAVYDVLRALTDAGLVRRFAPTGGAALHEIRTGDDHHHLVCRTCRAVDDVECAVGDARCLRPTDARGYEVDEAEVVFWGTCSRCRTTADDDLAPATGAHRPPTPTDPRPTPTTQEPLR